VAAEVDRVRQEAVVQADQAEATKQNYYHEAGKRLEHFKCFLLHIT
jgi:hypothetical protein